MCSTTDSLRTTLNHRNYVNMFTLRNKRKIETCHVFNLVIDMVLNKNKPPPHLCLFAWIV